jgi:hypothetical protein
MGDDEIIENMRKVREIVGLGNVLRLQLLNMDDKRLWRIYEKLDWYDDSPSVVGILGNVFYDPAKRYGDIAIRFAIHNAHRLRAPITPMQILLSNTYSKDIILLVTKLIENETPFWKSRVYLYILAAPYSVPDTIYTKWFQLLQEGVRYDAELSSAYLTDDTCRSNLFNYYVSTNRTITDNVKQRLKAEDFMRADLAKYHVDTNRALAWVLNASSHVDDTGWTYGDMSPSVRPLSERTNQVGGVISNHLGSGHP